MFNRSDAVFNSFNLETASKDVGFVQVSAEVFHLGLVRSINMTGKYKGEVDTVGDIVTNICCGSKMFNQYVKPESDAELGPSGIFG